MQGTRRSHTRCGIPTTSDAADGPTLARLATRAVTQTGSWSGARGGLSSRGRCATIPGVSLAIHVIFIPVVFLLGVYAGWQIREMRK